MRWVPIVSPEFDMIEEYWRQAEKDLSAFLVFSPTLPDMRKFLAGYYRTRRFHLDMKSFFLTNRGLGSSHCDGGK